MFKSYKALKSIAKFYSLMLAKAEVHGHHPLPAGAKIIAANHTLASDALQIPLVVKEKIHFLVQADLFSLPIIGWLLQQSGQIPVEQDDNQSCMALRHACRLLQDGKTIIIFPEGRLVPPGERVPAHSGAIRMAHLTGAPIIPLGIYVASENITTFSIHRFGRKRTGLWQTSGRCHLNFGAAWDPRAVDHSKKRLHAITKELMHRIYTLVAEAEKESSCASPVLLNVTPQP